MDDPNEVLAAVQVSLREGRVQDADNLITAHIKELAAAGAAQAIPAVPAPPREPMEVILDILAELIAAAGNKESLVRRLTELRAVL
jgi:hypothetical protein